MDVMDVSDQGGLLRVRDGGEVPVTPMELFFDVVFVFAVTQLSSRLLEHLLGIAHTTLSLRSPSRLWSSSKRNGEPASQHHAPSDGFR